MPVRVCRAGDLSVVPVFELDRWDEADLAMETSVTEPVDVLDDGDLEVVDGPPRALVADQLGLAPVYA